MKNEKTDFSKIEMAVIIVLLSLFYTLMLVIGCIFYIGLITLTLIISFLRKTIGVKNE